MPPHPLPPPRCWAEIDCAAIQHNVGVCRELAGPQCAVMAIVKADAYGHGLKHTGRVLAEAGVSWFGVANVEEALKLEDAVPGFDGILVLSAAACDEEREVMVRYGFSGVVSSVAEVSSFSRIAGGLQMMAKLHAVVDTGMGRMGIDAQHIGDLIENIKAADSVTPEGLATHFPSADEDEAYTHSQIARFQALIPNLDLPEDCRIHLANSAGLIGYQKEMPQAKLVRPGLALYGISPLAEAGSDLRPTLSLKTRLTLVRDIAAGTSLSYGRTFIAEKPMRVATLAAGYGDGYPRHLSGSGIEVLIAGKRCPLLGRVTMDQVVVDVTALEADEVHAGDEAVLIGSQGQETVSTEEVAEKAGTIPWEILTGLTNRVRRLYL